MAHNVLEEAEAGHGAGVGGLWSSYRKEEKD